MAYIDPGVSPSTAAQKNIGSAIARDIHDIPRNQFVTGQNIKLYVQPIGGKRAGQLFEVGMVQNIDPSQTREFTEVRQLGHGDEIFEQVPGYTAYTLSFGRIALYRLTLMEALGYGGSGNDILRSLQQVKDPINLIEMIDEGGPDSHGTLYRSCWLNSWDNSIDVGTITITENVAFDCLSVEPWTAQ
jgi:hypothetical protein